MLDEGVAQPLLVTISAITLASETVRSILKIDDIVSSYSDKKKFTEITIQVLFGQVNALH